MEQPLWLVGAALSSLFFVAVAAAAIVLAYQERHARRNKPRRVLLTLPSAEETREAVASFQAAVRRDELIEFVWRKLGPSAFAARCGSARR